MEKTANQMNNKIWLILGLVGLGVVMVFALFTVGSRAGKVEIKVELSPKDSTLTIDGKKAKAGTVYLSKGKHTLKATRQHFKEVTKEIDTNNLPQPPVIYLIAATANAQGEKYLVDHPDELEIRQLAGGQEVSEGQDKLYEGHPVIQDLPVDAVDYSIDYALESDGMVFSVKLFPQGAEPGSNDYKAQLEQYKAAALAWLESKGVDTKKAKIIYTPDPSQF